MVQATNEIMQFTLFESALSDFIHEMASMTPTEIEDELLDQQDLEFQYSKVDMVVTKIRALDI